MHSSVAHEYSYKMCEPSHWGSPKSDVNLLLMLYYVDCHGCTVREHRHLGPPVLLRGRGVYTLGFIF